ncbi:MAG: hypothetical protein ILP22_04790 [Oscillospiraceae bacterium]|nr:hypothetical protein [Oscillospiraceae bacterium]
MNDVKRISAMLVASAMFVMNMTCAAVSADEISLGEGAAAVQGAESAGAAYGTGTDDESVPDAEPDTENEAGSVEEQENISGESAVQKNDEENSEDTADSSDSNSEADNEAPDAEQEKAPEPLPEPNGDDHTGGGEASAVNKGKGDIEGLVNTKVFQVTLPVHGNSLDYVADPQGLIRKTNAAKHPDSVYDANANVFFNNGKRTAEGGKNVTYFSGTSDPLTIVNKSSAAVTIVARVSAYYEQGVKNPVSVAGSRDWENVSTPSICLSVVRDDDGSEVVLSKHEKVITASVAGCPEAYRFVYEKDGSGEENYGYRITEDEYKFSSFSLRMTGECNSDGDWKSDTDYDFPSTSIVWNVGFAVSAKPCVNEDYYTVAFGSEIKVPFSLGLFEASASGIAAAEFQAKSGETVMITGNGDYISNTENEITLTSDFASYARSLGGGTLKLTFDDPDETYAEIRLDESCAPFIETTDFSVSKNDKKLYVPFITGAGEKSASGISSVKFGSYDFSSSAYVTEGTDGFTLTASALNTICSKGGGTVYVTFNDAAHTRCRIKVNVDTEI